MGIDIVAPEGVVTLNLIGTDAVGSLLPARAPPTGSGAASLGPARALPETIEVLPDASD